MQIPKSGPNSTRAYDFHTPLTRLSITAHLDAVTVAPTGRSRRRVSRPPLLNVSLKRAKNLSRRLTFGYTVLTFFVHRLLTKCLPCAAGGYQAQMQEMKKKASEKDLDES